MKIDFTKNPSGNRNWGTTFRVTWIFIFIMFLPFTLHSQTSYNIWYVTPTGAGNQTGTDRGNAWSLSSMNQNIIQPGDFVYFGEGNYSSAGLSINKSGLPGKLITFMSDPSNTQPAKFYNRSRAITVSPGIQYIRIKGFHFQNIDEGVYLKNTLSAPIMKQVYIDSLYMTKIVNPVIVFGAYNTNGTTTPETSRMDSIYIRWCYMKIDTQTTLQTDGIQTYHINNLFIIGNYIAQENQLGAAHDDNIQTMNCIGNLTIANNYIINLRTADSQALMLNWSWPGYTTRIYNNVIIHPGGPTALAGFFPGPAYTVPAGRGYIYNNTTVSAGMGNGLGGTDSIMAYKNNIAIRTGGSYDAPIDLNPTHNKSFFDYNLYYSTETGYVAKVGTLNQWTWTQWQSLGGDLNGKHAPPLFTNQSNHDYSLQAGSPAIGAGVNLQSEVEGWGIEGVHWEGFNNPYVPWSNPVARGNNPTIGAWEFTNGTGGNYPPNPPADPFPANGAIDQQTSLTLSWSCTDPDGDPLTYDVYFGTNSNPPLASSNLTDASFNPGSLETNTTYYWKIVAKDNQGHSTSGQTWHFATIFVDTTPPELLSAALLDSVTLKLTFSEPLEQSTAQNINNYSITGGITISSASLSGSEVTLTTSTHSPGSYTVTVSNVTDLAGNIISPSANSAEYEFSTVTELVQLNIIDAVAQQWFQNYIPPNSIDGITYYIDPESRWGGAIPMPDEIIFDLGTTKSIGQTRFSFVWWYSGRIYIYSVYSSMDGNNWSLIADSVTSASDEWSILDFDIVQCRYVKLISLSNNQTQWAGLYEAEIWGLDSVTPVELTSFEGEYNDGKVNLKWITSAETNFHGFDVERRTENSAFEKIAFINGNGTTTNSHNYNYTDQNLSESKYYYRLKEISLNGNVTYSSEIMVDIPALANFELQQNYPNPFNPSTKISIRLPHKTSIKLSVYNMLGELIREIAGGEYESGTHTFDFDASGLSSGIYFYRIESPDFVDTKKMTVIK